MSTAALELTTAADLAVFAEERLGGVSPKRIRLYPTPGTAMPVDVQRLQEHEGVLCELVDGVLVEKAVGWSESNLAAVVLETLNSFVRRGNHGFATGADGTVKLFADLVRIPDVAFIRWDRLPGRRRPSQPIPKISPNLVVEVLSKGNSAGEMRVKRREYFAAGVELVWEVNPRRRTVAVYTSPNERRLLTEVDTLDGGAVLPGFSLSVRELFAELDRCA